MRPTYMQRIVIYRRQPLGCYTARVAKTVWTNGGDGIVFVCRAVWGLISSPPCNPHDCCSKRSVNGNPRPAGRVGRGRVGCDGFGTLKGAQPWRRGQPPYVFAPNLGGPRGRQPPRGRLGPACSRTGHVFDEPRYDVPDVTVVSVRNSARGQSPQNNLNGGDSNLAATTLRAGWRPRFKRVRRTRRPGAIPFGDVVAPVAWPVLGTCHLHGREEAEPLGSANRRESLKW